jgi:hypothetical protein
VKPTGRPQAARDPNVPQQKVARSDLGAEILFLRSWCGRFGEPSSYSLSRPELAAHIRRLRDMGWAPWELAARFGQWAA